MSNDFICVVSATLKAHTKKVFCLNAACSTCRPWSWHLDCVTHLYTYSLIIKRFIQKSFSKNILMILLGSKHFRQLLKSPFMTSVHKSQPDTDVISTQQLVTTCHLTAWYVFTEYCIFRGIISS